MRALLLRSTDDLFGRQADTLIADIHAAISCAEGDLFGPVGMAIEPRLADEELQTPPEAVAHRVHGIADLIKPLGHVRRAARYTRGSAIFAVDGAHLLGPFPRRH